MFGKIVRTLLLLLVLGIGLALFQYYLGVNFFNDPKAEKVMFAHMFAGAIAGWYITRERYSWK